MSEVLVHLELPPFYFFPTQELTNFNHCLLTLHSLNMYYLIQVDSVHDLDLSDILHVLCIKHVIHVYKRYICTI